MSPPTPPWSVRYHDGRANEYQLETWTISPLSEHARQLRQLVSGPGPTTAA